MSTKNDKSLIFRLTIVLIPIFLVLIIAIVATFYLQNTSQIKNSIEKDAQNKGVLFNNLMNELQDRALESATLISSFQMVRDAYKNPDETSAATNLQTKIVPELDKIMTANGLESFKVHFHKPGAKSFLRTWTKKRFDDLSSFRLTILEVEKTKKPVKGVELGVGGFAIRGLAPIFDSSKYVGSVEMFYNPFDAIKSMPKSGGNSAAFYLVNSAEATKLFQKEALDKNFPTAFGERLVSKIEEEWLKPEVLLSQEKIDLMTESETIVADKVGNLGVSYIPIKDFSGKNIGAIVYVRDQTDTINQANKSMLQISLIAALFIIIILIILMYLIKSKVSNPLKDISAILNKLSHGDVNINFSGDTNDNAQHDELVIMQTAFVKMVAALKGMITQVNDLTNNAIEGNLSKRGEEHKFEGAYREIVAGVNSTLDTIIGPLNVTAEYVDRIAKGNIPPRIVDEYRGDFNAIKNNINQAIDVMNFLLEEVNSQTQKIIDGKLDSRANSSRFEGGWADLIEGINGLNDAFIAPLNVTAEYVDRISKGDIPPKIVDDYRGDFNEIKNNLNQAIDVMNGLVKEINKQIQHVKDGKLDARADSRMFVGSWAELVDGINGLNDAFVAPLNVTAEYVDRISKGDLPPKITDEYKGDFNEIKNNLNLCIDSIQHLIDDADMLSDAAMRAKLRVRADENKHFGDFRKIIMGINSSLDQVVNILDTIDAPIMGIDKEFNIVYMNKLGASLNKKKPNELAGTKCYEHFKTSHCETEQCACHIAIKQNKEARGETDAHPGNLDLEIKYSGFPIRDRQGKVIGAFEIVLDQTEVKNAAQKAGKISAYQADESKKITSALQSIAKGNVDVNYSCHVEDPDLAAACESFTEIATALVSTAHAIKQLTTDTEKLAKESAAGNLSYRADETIHHGEYKEILVGVNRTLDYLIKPLNETSEILQIMATGDLTQRVTSDYKGDFVKLKNSVNALGDSLSNLIEQVNDTVQTTASSAMEISSTAESLAAASQEQSAQADEVASAVEEMSRTVSENAMSANKTSEMAQENSNVATEGGRVVQQTVQKMRDIAKVVENSALNIAKLGESSKQIGEIISVIDDIADQTNLLALNAAIEAARAGEQGRGFAVVADEVRKLAERTTDATKQIAGMIKGIQSETEQAVVAMNKGNEEVKSGIELADRAGTSLESILQSTQDLMDMINQIAAASEEQSATSEQISKNVVSISKVTADSTRRIEDVAHTSEDLARLTEHLSELMGQFQISQSGGSKQLHGRATRHLHA